MKTCFIKVFFISLMYGFVYFDDLSRQFSKSLYIWCLSLLPTIALDMILTWIVPSVNQIYLSMHSLILDRGTKHLQISKYKIDEVC